MTTVLDILGNIESQIGALTSGASTGSGVSFNTAGDLTEFINEALQLYSNMLPVPYTETITADADSMGDTFTLPENFICENEGVYYGAVPFNPFHASQCCLERRYHCRDDFRPGNYYDIVAVEYDTKKIVTAVPPCQNCGLTVSYLGCHPQVEGADEINIPKHHLVFITEYVTAKAMIREELECTDCRIELGGDDEEPTITPIPPVDYRYMDDISRVALRAWERWKEVAMMLKPLAPPIKSGYMTIPQQTTHYDVDPWS